MHKKKRGGAEESRAEQRRQDQTSSAECLRHRCRAVTTHGNTILMQNSVARRHREGSVQEGRRAQARDAQRPPPRGRKIANPPP